MHSHSDFVFKESTLSIRNQETVGQNKNRAKQKVHIDRKHDCIPFQHSYFHSFASTNNSYQNVQNKPAF